MLKPKIILLTIIIIVGAIIRLYHLGSIPRGLYNDEVSLGYNAWSILHTGADEYGTPFPTAFKAFGEYKLPGYIYLSTPLIALFGLNAFSIRLLSTLAGIIAIPGIYLLTQQLLSNDKDTSLPQTATPTIAATLLALSPWSINLSRGAFEANVALTAMIFAMYLYIKFLIQPKLLNALSSLILFIIAMYTYNAFRIVVPVVVLVSAIVFLAKHKNKKIIAFIISILTLALPAILGSIIGAESSRLKAVIEFENKQYLLGPLLGTLQKYLTQFSPDFLFFKGDFNPRHSVVELGMTYLPQLPFLVVGIFVIAYKHKKSAWVLFWWLLIAAIPSAIATPVPHALRAINLLPALTILSALGFTTTLQQLQLIPYKKLVIPITISVLTAIFAFSVYTYIHVYFIHWYHKTSWDWSEDKTVLAQYLSTHAFPSSNIFIEGDETTDSIYIKFFTAQQNKFVESDKYYYYKSLQDIQPQPGDVIAIQGWKGTPDQLTNTVELKMINQSIGYKVGVWRETQ